MAICPMPWFPIYAAEILADEDFAAWSPGARGCWLVLVARCWKDGSIPSDLEILSRLCNESAEAMREHWRSIGSKFQAVEGCPDRLIGVRTEHERELAIAKAEKLVKRGQAGAAARWKDNHKVLKHTAGVA